MVTFDYHTYLLTKDLPGGPVFVTIDEDFGEQWIEEWPDSLGQRIGLATTYSTLSAFVLYVFWFL